MLLYLKPTCYPEQNMLLYLKPVTVPETKHVTEPETKHVTVPETKHVSVPEYLCETSLYFYILSIFLFNKAS